MENKPMPARTKWEMRLTCSKCGAKVLGNFPSDPTLGEGWPMHRCGFDIKPFDKGEPTKTP